MPYIHKKQQLKEFFFHRHKRAQISLATVSGVLSTKPQMIKYVDTTLLEFDIITSKSFQVTPNSGNKEPIICEIEVGSYGNSVGLRNPGMDVAYRDLEELRKRHSFRAFLNISVSASSIEDFITLIKKFNPIADIIELNFSCPHAEDGYGSSIGCSKVISSEYMRRIREAVGGIDALIFPKLTPNVDNIGEIAASLIDNGADGLSLINTVGPTVHISSVSATPILQNSLGGKGGMSGSWVYERALECVKEVRGSVGPDVPIIGMGGVSKPEDIVEMIRAGSDVVGIGSAFGKVHQKQWPLYTHSLVTEAAEIFKGNKDVQKSSTYTIKEKRMEYEKHTILERTEIGKDTFIITLDGKQEYHGGEFVFLWLPQIGEKPFSIASSTPLSFIIKVKGEFTKALSLLNVGDIIYSRGLYGSPVEIDTLPNSLLIAGGTGIAVLPPVAKELTERGVNIYTLVGTSENRDHSLHIVEQKVASYGPL
ncbi:MAG: dihydroorotate dehydrogenase, partial [Spirochaetia bacterium]|nr:dihydroorotate dehydrogenase [Spirochaetia bacterium]